MNKGSHWWVDNVVLRSDCKQAHTDLELHYPHIWLMSPIADKVLISHYLRIVYGVAADHSIMSNSLNWSYTMTLFSYVTFNLMIDLVVYPENNLFCKLCLYIKQIIYLFIRATSLCHKQPMYLHIRMYYVQYDEELYCLHIFMVHYAI